MNLPKVTVVVLNYNGFDDTANCVSSLLESDYQNLSVVIVDNASPDRSGQKLQERFPEIPVILSEFNGGYAGGMNLGAKLAVKNGADYVVYSNNDLVFDKTAISKMTETAMSDPSIGIVSPKVLFLGHEDTIYCAGGTYNFWRGGPVSTGRGMKVTEFGHSERDISHTEGACMMISRKVIEEFGYMKEIYFMYCEDLAYSYEVSKKFKLRYTPRAIVYHRSGAGKNWGEQTSLYHYYFTRNRLLFFRDFNLFSRIYILIYSFLIVVLKSLTLLFVKKGSEFSFIRSLWGGLKDGALYILRFRKVKDEKPLIKAHNH
ncbi:MAG: glycosyltransferase family 2 protein [Ignavibacteriaceae bacterium]|nr:glycosyltransferase family 2 protein [Ignavibacteriaceae bacterium]